jgi:hypothetical protein
MARKWATARDLGDPIADPSRRGEMLYNPRTGEEYSANRSDYFMTPDQHVFTGFVLARRVTTHVRVA